MNRVIMFSGGFDSTYLVRYVINNKYKEGDVIYLISMDIDITGEAKNVREKEARENIIRLFRKEFMGIPVVHIGLKLEGMMTAGEYLKGNRGLSHPILWASNLVPLLHDGDRVYFGYIKGDDALLFRETYEEMLRAMCKFQENKDVKFKFPLCQKTKEEILYDLIDTEYFRYCTSCESPIMGSKHCGCCLPCKHLKTSLMLGSILYEDKSDKFKEELSRRFGGNLK